MHRFKTLIIEDEPAIRKELEWMVTQKEELALTAVADSVAKALDLLAQTTPDLVLMDIQLEDGTAFDILHHHPSPAFRIIFITAYDHYAIRAIRYGALDYLLKPIDQQDFNGAIERLKKQEVAGLPGRLDIARQMAIPEKAVDMNAQICIAATDCLQMIRLADVMHLSGEGAYTKIFLQQGKRITASKPLKYYEELLPGENFIRPHQSYIVNRQYIDKYLKSGILVMRDQTEIPVATRRKEFIINCLTTLK
ncbi:DNA-binding response regulator [Chitinophaga lutea]|uniref:DNA-binding response regulator n=1 Tax=Chitinophaga lutea TaxID=2488634 RepID=A0A3N4QM49_9BACT|nr:LytTR family DNA-binding domain-containing protein [Chitinophaga lutea]RPE12774.1 DNA-binding response regulator [Chitinophaga lutea]